MTKSKYRNFFSFSLLLTILILGGCAGSKVATDLLAGTNQEVQPLVNNTVITESSINSEINNYEKLDETVKISLDQALGNANLFGSNSVHPYTIKAHIDVASQAAWSFGNFTGKLRINYSVLDDSQNMLFEESIYTEAGSDKNSFSGAKRHRRARAVNISKNVLEFVERLRTELSQ